MMTLSPGETAECPCRSGLAARHCCQADFSLEPSETDAIQARAKQAEALGFLQSGNIVAAASSAREALSLVPANTACLGVLWEACNGEHRVHTSEVLLRRIVLLEPNNSLATNKLALLLLARGDLAEAERHARNAVRTAPESAESHYLLGLVLTEGYRPVYGEYHLREAMRLAGAPDAVLLANLGLCLKTQGKIVDARAAYAESLAIAPDALHTLLGMARLEEADRNLDAALQWLDGALAAEPGNASALLLRAVVLGRQRKHVEALALLDRLGEGRAQLSPAEWLEKGRLLDKMGEYDSAFDAFEQGKARLREMSGLAYSATLAEHTVQRLRGFFTARRLRTLPVADTRADVAQPLFILGFPRSGTTLLEQSLTAHSRICAGDELPIVADITGLMPRMLDSPLSYPDALAELWMADHRGDLNNLRDYYLQRVAQLGIVEQGAAWFTDKMPLNETNLGLIALIFPRAPLIHVVRHPLDVVVSVFSNLLTHGYFCSYALETIAKHYVLVADLVENYRQEMNLHYKRVRYEDVVETQEATIRETLDFIGEDYEPACLDFHRNRRYARTASYAQVSEKLYDGSRFRYRNYLAQLQPVLPILEATISRLGYSI